MSDLTMIVKVRLKPTSKQSSQFADVSEIYRQACNIVSIWYFNHHFNVARSDFNKDMYYVLKETFPKLNTAMIQSTYRTVKARYDTVETQLSKKPYKVWSGKYSKKGKKIYLRIDRDLEWLQKNIYFKRPQADYLRNINYSFTHKYSQISLNVLGKRIKVDYSHNFNNLLFAQTSKLGTAKLVNTCSHWYLHIPVTFDVTLLNNDQIQHVVGIDRGLRFLATCYDEKGKTNFISGKHTLQVRRKYKKLRTELQKRGTKSAKRRLKKIGNRENRWMSDVNHQLSKTLVNQFESETLFVLEDLTGVKKTVKQRKQDDRYEQASWAFYQLEMDLTYKALQAHSLVIKVPAQYTSQRCPHCGRINKANRNHSLHLYKCDRCGYSSNDDRIGAMNIYQLGLMSRNGIKNVKFNK